MCFNRKEHKDLKDQLLNALFRNQVYFSFLCVFYAFFLTAVAFLSAVALAEVEA